MDAIAGKVVMEVGVTSTGVRDEGTHARFFLGDGGVIISNAEVEEL